MTGKTAVVLFNLGGPDALSSVRPFLFNLFRDPAIIRSPLPVRYALAALISTLRTPKAKNIYAQMGGKSPITEQTDAQARVLEEELSKNGEWRVFYTMRYWKPRSAEVAKAVKEYAPERVVLLPLYPQFSTTTTASSLQDWERAARKAGINAPTTMVCCYPTDLHFTAAYADLTREAYFRAAREGTPRVLFSAHGLPEKVIKAGDPYQWQVEQSVAGVIRSLGIEGLDYSVCYQSRVGPLQWIGPSTEEEIRRAGADKVPLVVVPVAFVSEHSETRVELDVEYAHLAESVGVPHYVRAPALSTHPVFIEGLAALCRNAKDAESGLAPPSGGRLCPARFSECKCFASADVKDERKAA